MIVPGVIKKESAIVFTCPAATRAKKDFNSLRDAFLPCAYHFYPIFRNVLIN